MTKSGAQVKLDWTKLLNGDRRRKSSSDKPVEHRVSFERDYDRLLFSTPVRRLYEFHDQACRLRPDEFAQGAPS
jgi:dGTP triphosphohydrolase